MELDYDVLVIGSGPAGQKAAIQAAKLHRRVAVVECSRTLGGGCVNTGTIPSKTIREAIIYLTGLNQRAMYGQGYRLRDEISMQDIRTRTAQVVDREQSVVRDQLLRNHVSILEGTARFLAPTQSPSPTGAAVSGASPRRRSSSRSARRRRTSRRSSSTARPYSTPTTCLACGASPTHWLWSGRA